MGDSVRGRLLVNQGRREARSNFAEIYNRFTEVVLRLKNLLVIFTRSLVIETARSVRLLGDAPCGARIAGPKTLSVLPFANNVGKSLSCFVRMQSAGQCWCAILQKERNQFKLGPYSREDN